MKFIERVWKWFNGAKTVIGLFIVALASQDFFQAWVSNLNVIDALTWLGTVLAGGGIVHKVVKNVKNK